MPRKTVPFVVAALTCATFSVHPARADNKAECADAYGKAQTLRDAQKLIAAREQLRICARTTCTQFIARDCASWLGEIESRVPSVVLFARDVTGSDVAHVTVSMDGTPIAQQLDGHAIDVDAGRHTFVFVLPGDKKLEQTYVVLEGQKAQRVGVTVAPPPPVRTAEQALPAVGAESHTSSWNGWKTTAVVLGVAGLAGLAVGSYFGVSAMQSASKQSTDCPAGPNAPCSEPGRSADSADRSNGLTASTNSNIAFAAGGTLLAAGVVLFFVAPKSSEQASDATRTVLRVAPSIGPSGGGFNLQGTF